MDSIQIFRAIIQIAPIRTPLSLLARALDWARNRERYTGYRDKYDIDNTFKFQGEFTKINGLGSIHLGPHGYIGGFCKIVSIDGTSVTVGPNCAIGSNVRIYTSTRSPDQDLADPKDERKSSGDVTIGKGVWIGDNVFITPSVQIGDNVVVGANSVVTKDIDKNTVVGGVPAHPIRDI